MVVWLFYDSEGYKLFDLVTHQFHVSPHVTFVETSFSFAEELKQSHSHLFIPPDSHYSNDEIMISFLDDINDQVSLDSLSPLPDTLSNSHDNTCSEIHDINLPSSDLQNVFPESSPESITIPPPIQCLSLHPKFKPTSMKYYITSTGQAKANIILPNCPIDSAKYNMSHYSTPTQLYACTVSPYTAFREFFTYDLAVIDDGWIEAMNKE